MARLGINSAGLRPAPEGQRHGMLDEEAIAALRGTTVIADGEELGEVADVYTHSWDDRPALLSVETVNGPVLVPLPDGGIAPDGDQVRVPFASDLIVEAPASVEDALTESDFEAVYAHYGISDATMREDSGAFREGTGGGADPRTDAAADDAQQGHP